MMKRFPYLYSGVLALWAVSMPSAAGTKTLKVKPAAVISAASEILPETGNTQVTPDLPALEGFTEFTESKSQEAKASESKSGFQDKAASKESVKAALGDALISQNTLRIFLDRPAVISVFNGRGQMVFHLDSQRAMETLPLQDMQTGFLYLTLRAGQSELTKKLLYTGK